MKELMFKSVAAGFLVGVGVVINTLAPNPIVGSMLFSVALLAIIKNGLMLYTGKIGYVREIPFKTLMIMLLGNFVGVLIPVFMMQGKNIIFLMDSAAQNKFSADFLALFFYGCLCGVMMFLAVFSKDTVITVFCIMTFILSGFEHCIADFPYLLLRFTPVNLVKFLCIILGNSLGSIGFYFLVQKYPLKKEKE